MIDREALEKELAELIAANEAETSWGAAVGACLERIKEIKGILSRPMSAVTFRDSRSGRVAAAYSGQCRIGYLDQRADDTWRWSLAVLSPEGSSPSGVCSARATAELALSTAFDAWLRAADLRRTT